MPLFAYSISVPLESYDDDDMKLRKEDQEWLTGEISRVVQVEIAALADSLNPGRGFRIMRWLKDWGATSAIWAVPLGLLGMVITLGIFASNGISKNATFQATTEDRLKQIEKTLEIIHHQQISQDLTNHAILPLEQFGRSLSSLGSSIASARALKVSVSSNVIDDLQTKMINTDHTTPDYWPTAVQLVDLKFQNVVPVLHRQNCLDLNLSESKESDLITTSDGRVIDFPQFSGPQVSQWMAHVLLSNCNLDLDDNEGFSTTSVGKFFQRVKEHHPQVNRYFIILTNAHVTYSGGKMLPINGITFQNCSFEFLPPTQVPTKALQVITTQLIASEPLKGTVTFPDGM